MSDILKIAVIGTGWIASTFKLAQKFVPNVKLVGCCDLNEKLAKKFACKAMPYFTKSEDLYKNADFDAVYLALPHFLHRPMIEEALDAGKDVLCEKPLTTTLDDAHAIINKAQSLNRKVGVMYQYRYDARCYQLARACQSGHLGKLYWGKVEVPWFRNERYFQKGDWRRSWSKAGGGTLLIHASHSIDILCWAFGKPVEVSGNIATLHQNTEVEDVGVGTVRFENGAIATILGTSLSKPPKPTKIEVCSEKGRLELTRFSELSFLRWRGCPHFASQRPSNRWLDFSGAIEGFANWILHDTPYLCSVEQSIPVLSVVFGIYESSLQEKKIQLNS